MTKQELIKKLEDVDNDAEILIYSIEAKEDENCMPIPIVEINPYKKEIEIFIEM